MPDMGYLAVKKALAQIRRICNSHTYCEECEFRKARGECEFALMGNDPNNLLPGDWTLDLEDEQ